MVRKLAIAISTLLFAALVWSGFTNLRTALQRSRQKRTMADMRSIATALESRATDFKSFTMGPIRRLPTGTMHRVSQAELERAIVPVYARTLPRLDGWGQPLRVYVGGYDDQGRARDYAIRSFGSDHRADTSHYTHAQISRFDQDLVFSAGNFIRYPEGI